MTSMRKLNRRLLRWQRYARRTCWNPRVTRPRWMGPDVAMADGHTRAWSAQQEELERRRCFTPYDRVIDDEPCDCPDCAGNYRCCTAGDDGHPGPCVTTCTSCGGDGRCPECGGVDDLGCSECDGSGSCSDCWGQGEHIEDSYIGPRVETVTIRGGLL